MRFRLNSLEDTRKDRASHVRKVLGEDPVARGLVKLAEDFLVCIYGREMRGGILYVRTAAGDLERNLLLILINAVRVDLRDESADSCIDLHTGHISSSSKP
jgi:glutamate synthase domain-containing protein 3